jgi:UDP-3-O-[3-hydroxymyristoyl] glucosamine N-acyltransferase
MNGAARIHPTAVVEGIVGKGCRIGPHCVVMAGAELGANCVLESSVTVYPHVKIGEGCIFQAGAVIGSRGFGFYEYQGKRRKIPHLAGVRIGDRCSFGANTVVAAGFLAPTSIGNDSHFDSMVEIAHNCKVGNHVFMASQSALAGSVTVGDGSEFAGAAKVADHITIGKNVRVAAKAGVTRDVPDGKTVSGFPALEIDLWRRCMVRLKQLGKK